MKSKVIILVGAFLILQFQSLNAQEKYKWSVNVNTGSTMLWGDMADNENPFVKMFSDQSKLSFGLTVDRQFTNAFGLQGGFLYARLAGQRTLWSNDVPANLGFEGTAMDYYIAPTIDFTGMFGAPVDRLISIYIFGGIGQVHYQAEKMDISNNQSLNKVGFNGRKSALIIPWGGGVKLRLNDRFKIKFENSYRNLFVDDIDAHVGSGTNINDIYSYTSIGLDYRFKIPVKREPQIEIEPILEDTVIADADTVEEYKAVDVKIKSQMPSEIENGVEYTSVIGIDKGSLNNKAKLSMSAPDGFNIEEIESEGGEFSFNHGKLVINWSKLPANEILNIKFKIKTDDVQSDNYEFNGILIYTEEDKEKIKQFKSTVRVKQLEVVAQNNEETPKTDDKQKQLDNEEVENIDLANNSEGIEFRVQIAAVYGGKLNTKIFAERNNINSEIKEDFFKGYYMYSVGSYTDYKSALKRLDATNTSGAYIVAFKNGKRVHHLYDLNKDVMDQNGVIDNALIYKVQISASRGRPYSIIKLAHKYNFDTDEIYEDVYNSRWHQYSVGEFNSIEEAKKGLSKIKSENEVEDAFIVKFRNGKRTR